MCNTYMALPSLFFDKIHKWKFVTAVSIKTKYFLDRDSQGAGSVAAMFQGHTAAY